MRKKVFAKTDLVEWMDPAMQKARECAECEECLERCPYDLVIPELLKKNISFWDECKRRAGEARTKHASLKA
ncbi:hypothetical protein LCGC14_2333440 [marine sediment metagenome]|uniref:4Fe-4S ferredoxin-type domain-containing protein n=1 Tax=marine sediment metagenome TaxID=412755 RepID=A0A0F9CE19_9ZZZZ